jgi:hypothetical protein
MKKLANIIKDNAPLIAFFSGNIILAIAEFRVFDFTFRMTNDPFLGTLAVFSTYIPFVLWEIMWQHKYATIPMCVIAISGMALSFILGVCVGCADYILATAAGANAIVDAKDFANLLLVSLAASMGVHGLGLLIYFYAHPNISADRRETQAVARMERAKANVMEAQVICALAREKEQALAALISEYGVEGAESAIADITGKEKNEADTLAEWFNKFVLNADNSGAAFANNQGKQPRTKKSYPPEA